MRLIRAQNILAFFIALCAGLLYVRFSKGLISYRPVVQPVAYNHHLHVHEKEISCEDCHPGVKTNYVATLPTVETCGMCHSEPQGSSDKEKRFIDQYVKAEQPILWQRLFVLPQHVFFSHRVHVVRAELACQVCHGPMDMQKKPAMRALKVLTMDDCIDCHKKKNAVLDCNGCHR